MTHRLWIFAIGVAGVLVLVSDLAARLGPSQPASIVLDMRPGLRRLATAVDEYEKKHGRLPPNRVAFDDERHWEPDLASVWNCPRCGLPYALGRAKNTCVGPTTWPFDGESADQDPDAAAAFCPRCTYTDGTVDVLTFDGRIGSRPRCEVMQRFVATRDSR